MSFLAVTHLSTPILSNQQNLDPNPEKQTAPDLATAAAKLTAGFGSGGPIWRLQLPEARVMGRSAFGSEDMSLCACRGVFG